LAPATAAIDPQISSIVKQELGADIRIDGIAQQGSKQWLLLVPAQQQAQANGITLSYKSANGDLLLSNNWIYTPIIPGRKDNLTTIKSFDFYPQEIKNNILSSIIIPEFIIPKGFVLPRDLAMLAGHLPIGLSDVELASDREAEFRRRLKADEANNLSLISYDHNSGEIKNIEFKDKLETKPLVEASKQLAFVTALKSFDKEIYAADYNKATIYKLKSSPEEYLKLGKAQGLKDFAFSYDGTLLYVLTAKDSKLLVYKRDGLKLMRELDIASGAFGLMTYSADAGQADYVAFALKSSAEINLVSSFEHRITSRISTANLDLMPDAFTIAAGEVFIIARDRIKDKAVKLVAMDIVSAKLDRYIDLDFMPSAILSHAGSVYVAGNSKLIRLNPVTKEITATVDLGTDLVDPRSLHLTKTAAFMLIACSGSNNIGVIDLASMQLVKKIDIGSRAHQLLVW